MKRSTALAIGILVLGCGAGSGEGPMVDDGGTRPDAPISDAGSEGSVPPGCGIGAPANLAVGPGPLIGDATGFKTITSCGTVSENVVLGTDLVAASGNCLIVAKDGMTIDGAGHTITAPGHAVWIQDRSKVTVRNINTNGSIYLYGKNTNACTIENSSIDTIFLREGDDHLIQNDALKSFSIVVDAASDPPLRLRFRRNHVVANSTDPVAFYGRGAPPCPETFFEIEENVLENASGPSDVPNVMRMGCSRKNVIRRNLLRGTGHAVGFYLRDEISDSLFEQNTVWTNEGEALRIASGNVDKGPPSRNVFRANLFRSDGDHATFIQVAPIDTRFEYDVFWGDTAWISGGHGNAYDHDTFVGTGNAVVRLIYAGGPTDAYTSNVFFGPGPAMFEFDGFSFDRYTGDHNVFFQSGGPALFKGTGGLAAWRAASVAKGHPSDQSSIEADPMFVDVAKGDFRLGTASAVRGKGAKGTDPGAFAGSCTP